jgi:hypothetical protein
MGPIRAPEAGLTTLAGRTVRRPGRVLRVDETTNEDTPEPLLNTNERVHSVVRVRLACGGLGLDDNCLWGCEALLGGAAKDGNKKGEKKEAKDGKGKDGKGKKGGSDAKEGKDKGGQWRLERGSALSEVEEVSVREAREKGPREVGVLNQASLLKGGDPEYPADVMHVLGEDDHKWRWVWQGGVHGQGRYQVPQALALPEEPLVGYWERYLLGLMAGQGDVWKYAQKGLQES